MTKPTLIYFAARGRAELIRLTLVEAGVAWDEHPIGKDTPAHNGRPTDFTALKQSGLLPFGAAPVWEEPDGFRLAQSLAIVNYLAATHGLHGKTPREVAKVHEMLGAFDDVRGELRRIVTIEAEKRAALREEIATKFLPAWCGHFDRLLDGRPHVVGDSMTVADLALWYLCELMNDNGFAALKATPRLQTFFEQKGQRQNLAAYAQSPKRFPFAPLPK